MENLEILPATQERFADVTTMLNPTGRGRACWCMVWRSPRGLDPQDRGEALRELTDGEPAPGLLAYVTEGGERTVVGWVGLAPHRLALSMHRSRVLPRRDESEWDTAWVVRCFVVRPGYRRRGIARALLEGAVEYVRSQGGVVVEGFPVDPEGERVDTTVAYVGTTSLFESAGFSIVEQLTGSKASRPRWVARMDLA
ncbi:MAG: GNAT family N-acetyltransferase [Cellulomonadaceae bacterium]|jgi:GNAT superfamily N-acetyltransferase|nr:GNAT family N-acetyltransferase [Cellulomonadaceae bacterium]